MKKYSKVELTNMAKQHGFFKKPSVQFVWARENGHFYYVQPPVFKDGLESFKITREELEGKNKKINKNKE